MMSIPKSKKNSVSESDYIVRDVLQTGLITVFCGRAPSKESKRRSAYYAHRSNKFWEILAETGLTDRQLEPEEFGSLPSYGIGLTDLNKTEFGSDHELTGQGDSPESVLEKIKVYRPRLLAFTGKNNSRLFFHSVFGISKNAEIEYGLQKSLLVDITNIHVLPSTSARARGYWNSDYWHELANHHRKFKLE